MSAPLDLLRSILPTGYSIDTPIAKGGQGAVYRGSRNGAPVAIKCFHTADIERLQREVNLLSRATCPSLVGLVDFHLLKHAGQTVPMVAYEYIDGMDLRAHVSGPVKMCESDLRRLGEHIGGAVEHLWSMRVVHRDIKPENVIAAADGRFVLVDVGFAQHLDLRTITAGGQPGTNGYRSPEQYAGRKKLTIHSDVFSLGVTVFEVASKRHPWDRNQVSMALGGPHALEKLRTDLDRPLVTLIHEMLGTRPGERPIDPGTRFRQL